MFAKIINNSIESYPYNPKSDYPLTSFPVGDSYPSFDCYWVYPITPSNPDPDLYNTVESIPVFNTELGRWEQGWEYIEKPSVIPNPNWHGLWTSLMMSGVYHHLSGLEIQIPQLSVAMGKVIPAIQYGMIAEDQTVALAAFQSAIDLLFQVLGLVNQSLSEEHVAETRQVLDSNHFTAIALP